MNILKRTDKYVIYSENGVIYICDSRVFKQKYEA